ncbi:hypothetical protein SK128_021862 [Halocaridina rubra]|uniref:Uncharacterized protein n=1 Tax=Halocaridina rubra TaxID=373956 RepID=A0AAN8WA21_HALRR
MAGMWRRIRNALSIALIVGLILYVAYCTEELYTRIQNNRKLQRLINYEKEINELTSMLGEYKKEASHVQRSLKLLREAFDQVLGDRKAKDFGDR